MSDFNMDLKNPITWLLAPLVAPIALVGGCDEGGKAASTDVDTDTDIDIDSDTDIDTDSDTDVDSDSDTDTNTECDPLTDAQAISARGGHTCAVLTSGTAKCWGANESGQLGNGTTENSSTPVDVVDLSSNVQAIAAGSGHGCAVLTSGDAKCWGANGYGELGDGETSDYETTPVDVVGLSSDVLAISAGYQVAGGFTCALLTSGGVKCWGYNSQGELGNGTDESSLTPVDVVGLTSGVQAISVGEGSACALLTSGGVKCWGWNIGGELGNGTVGEMGLEGEYETTPVDVVGLSSGVLAISSSGSHTCALLTSGGVMCWGFNESGQLGNGETSDHEATPVEVVGLSSDVQAISAGAGHTCALLTSGGVQCWGHNGYGQLGDGTTDFSYTPVDVVGLSSDAQAISAGAFYTCALLTSGGIQCWGANGDGQLGDGTTNDSTTPVDVIDCGE